MVALPNLLAKKVIGDYIYSSLGTIAGLPLDQVSAVQWHNIMRHEVLWDASEDELETVETSIVLPVDPLPGVPVATYPGGIAPELGA